MNKVESEWEWLLYSLWTKIGQYPSRFIFQVPETVFFRDGNPYNWYFTSKEGHVLKKNKINVNLKTIHLNFTKKLQQSDLVVATGLFYKKESQVLEIQFDHIPLIDFRTYLFYSDDHTKPNALQKFIHTKSPKTTIIKCHWSPALSIVEKLTNVNNFNDTRLSIDEKVCTFEGPEHLAKNDNVVSSSIVDDINASIRQIEEHMKMNCQVNLLGGHFYFKLDRDDDLILVFVSNIKIDQPNQHTYEGQKINLKLYNRNMHSQSNQQQQLIHSNTIGVGSKFQKNLIDYDDQLPAVTAPKRGSSSRPISHYQNRGGGAGSQKTSECPFCDTYIKNSDSFEFTFSQILKIYQFYEDSNDLLLEVSSSPNKFGFNKKLYLAIQNCRGKIPEPILKLYPNLTQEKYAQKKTDPLFLYDSLRVCETCYQYIKSLIEHLNHVQDNKDQRMEQLNKITALIYRPQSGISSKNCGTRPGTAKRQIGQQLKRGNTETLNSDLIIPMGTQQNIIKQSLQVNNNDKNYFSKQPSSAQYKLQNIPLNGYFQKNGDVVSDTESNRILIESDRDILRIENDDYESSSKGGGIMVFSKVEAGKEVIENNIFQLPKSASTTFHEQQQPPYQQEYSNYDENQSVKIVSHQQQDQQHKPKIVQATFNFVKVQPPLPKPKQQQKAILPKIDWQKEYKQQVKEKAGKFKTDIFEALERIESGQPVIIGGSGQDALNLNLLGIQHDEDDQSYNMMSGANNYPQSSYSVQPQTRKENANGENIIPMNIEGAISIYSKQQNTNLRIRPGFDQNGKRLSEEHRKRIMPQSAINSQITQIQTQFQKQDGYNQGVKKQRTGLRSAQSKEKREQKNALSDSKKPPKSGQRGNNQMKENVQLQQNSVNSNQSQVKKKLRPLSSKPPVSSLPYQQLQEGNLSTQQQHSSIKYNNMVSSSTSQKLLLISQRESSFENKQINQRSSQYNQLQSDQQYSYEQDNEDDDTQNEEEEYKKDNIYQGMMRPTTHNMQQQQQQQIQAPPSGGLFDFNNMTENDIKQIAQNADQLIEIIKNIKGAIDVPQQQEIQQNNNQGGIQNQLMQNNNLIYNIADIPCIEDDQEDEVTADDIRQQHQQKQNKNTNEWW